MNFNSSTFLYLKFLFIWLLIMIADFLLEFRFEFLWPFWLVIRSLHDSFKYQGIVSIHDCFSFCFDCLIILIYFLFFRLDIFNFFRVDYNFFRSIMLHVFTGPMAFFRGQHLRLGTVCVAYGKRRMFANYFAVALICLYWSFAQTQNSQNHWSL